MSEKQKERKTEGEKDRRTKRQRDRKTKIQKSIKKGSEGNRTTERQKYENPL